MTTLALIEADYGRYQQQIISIRETVFIIEQGVPVALEIDEFDPVSRHLLAFEKDIPIATGRLTPNGHIGRLAVLKHYHHQGFGTQLIATLEQMALKQELSRVNLGAQIQATNFYEKIDYHGYGGVFMDAG